MTQHVKTHTGGTLKIPRGTGIAVSLRFSNNLRSYICLGVVESADEDTILNAYIKQVEDDPASTTFYLECLQDISIYARSSKINEFLEQECDKGNFTCLDLDRAYRILEIDHPNDVDDEGIIAVFQVRCADAPEREREFETALRVIEYFRKLEATQRSDDSKEKRGDAT